MNLFQEILPEVREVMSRASPAQVHSLLGLMVEEGMLSEEYHRTLLGEGDQDDLARKISLLLVEQEATRLSLESPGGSLQPRHNPEEEVRAAAASSGTTNLGDCSMDTEILAGTPSYLELLYREDDAAFPAKFIADAVEISSDPPADPIGEEQENNFDDFFIVEKNDSGEEVFLCSNPGEAYEKIATLADYLLKGPEEKPVEEIFGSTISEEVVVGDPGGHTEAKRHCSSPNTPEPKRRRDASTPSLCILNQDSFVIPLDGTPAGVAFHPNFHVQFCMATIGPAGKPSKAFGPPAGLSLDHHLLTAKEIQVIVAFPPFAASVAAVNLESHPGEDLVDKGPGNPSAPPEPACQRPECVEAFCTSLKNHFRDRCRVAPVEQEIPLDELYIETRMVRCPMESKTGKNIDMSPCDLEERGRMIAERNQLFQMLGKSDPGTKIVAIFGKAGLGKSLLVQKLCLDWANGKGPEFDFIFRFDCRKLSLLLENRYSLRELLLGLSDGSQEGGEGVYWYLLERPEKVLLVFDGFEELNDQDGLMAPPESPPLRESFSIRSFLTGLFQRKVLRGCTLLLTLQPNARWHQYASRTDAILEMMGFSTCQVQTYLSRYLTASGCSTEVEGLIQNNTYLFSHCYNPGLCQLMGRAVSELGEKELPSTLTRLVAKMLLRRLAHPSGKSSMPRHQGISALTRLAWTLMQKNQNTFTEDHFPSAEVKEFALTYGLVEPFCASQKTLCQGEGRGYVFPSFVDQSFLVASHLVLAEEFKDKKLTQYLRLSSRTKRLLSSWDLVPTFMSGLLFLEEELRASLYFGQEGELDPKTIIRKKRNRLSKYIQKCRIRDLTPEKLLQLLHCVHETEDPYLLQHVALELQPDLSFSDFPLTPVHVYVLHSALRRSPKTFALDLNGSSIDPDRLGQLVTLKNVTSFRASLGNAVQLWRHLWEAREEDQLWCALEKFRVLPFRAKTMKDVDDLFAVVSLQEEMAPGKAEASGRSSRPIPAIAELRHLEFMLGPTFGLKGFQKLVKILDVFPALRHLDLDSPDENEIGDEGVGSLSKVLPQLTSLQTLNLSRNKITDHGAEKLATILPSLRLLRTLSLYNNSIGDSGAEHFAKALPRMGSLRVMDIHCNKITTLGAQKLTGSLARCPHMQSVALWNPGIPHSILDHLRQQDSRIRLL